jgi:hypothetical protein
MLEIMLLHLQPFTLPHLYGICSLSNVASAAQTNDVYIQVLLASTAQSNFMRLLVSTVYCSHHQGATVLQRHKQHIVCWQVVNVHTSAVVQQLINVQCN